MVKVSGAPGGAADRRRGREGSSAGGGATPRASARATQRSRYMGTMRRRLAVVLVHDDWDVRIRFDSRLDQVPQEGLARVLTRTGRALHDHRAVRLVGSLHDRADLLEVVDVEGGQAVTVFGRMIEQLAHRDERHGLVS